MSKLCCGLFGGAKDDDNDYVGSESLPPPQAEVAPPVDVVIAVTEAATPAPETDPTPAAETEVVTETIAVVEELPKEAPIAEAPKEEPEVAKTAAFPEFANTDASVDEETSAPTSVVVPAFETVAPAAAAATTTAAATDEPSGTPVEEAKEEPQAAAPAPAPKDDFDLAAFKEKLNDGVTVTKYNRHGKPATRVLYFDEPENTISWGETGTSHHKRTSSFLRNVEGPLPISTLVKVVPGPKASNKFYVDSDMNRSFQLLFPHRTVDITAGSEADAKQLMTGFAKLKESL